jgi:hypothetical protein
MSHPSTQVEQAPKEKASVIEDFIDIFYAPATVFARRANSSFWIPTIFVAICVGLLFFGNASRLEPIMDAEYQRTVAATMKANPQVTPEMMERGKAFAQTVTKVGAFIGVPIAIMLIGLVLWISGKMVDAQQTLGAALMVAAYSYMPRVLGGIAGAVQAFALDLSKMTSQYQLTFSPARFLDPETTSPILLAVASRFDVFTIWVTILLAIGLSVTGKIPRSKAAIAAVIVWVLGAVPVIYGASRM